MTAVVGLLASSGCSTRLGPDVEAGVPISRALAFDLLEADDVRTALSVARRVEFRLPGPDSDAMLGRALWRNGDLLAAEPFFRRSGEAGDPEGVLGMARVRAAQRRWSEATELAAQAAEDPATRARAAMLLALIERHRWRSVEGQGGSDVGSGGTQGSWSGAAAVVGLQGRVGDSPLVQVEIAGTPAMFALELDDSASRLSPALAQRVGAAPLATQPAGAAASGGPVAAPTGPRWVEVAAMAIGAASVRNPALAISELPAGVDGVLAPDLLMGARWSWEPATGVLAIAPATAAVSEAWPAELRLPERAALGWATARLVLDAHGLQLFLLPRIEGVTTPAALSATLTSRLDLTSTDGRRERAFEDAAGPLETGDSALLRTRIADRERIVEWQVRDLSARAGGGRVVPRAILGIDALGGWRLHWLPDQAMFALEPMTP